MKKLKKIIGFVLVTLLIAGCGDGSSNNDSSGNDDAPVVAENISISFVLPEGWITSTDEEGNLYVFRQNPYLVVAFRVFADRAGWQKRMRDFEETNDILLKNESVAVGGLPTTYLIFERETGPQTSFRYGEYFVDGEYLVDSGARWFEISTADPDSVEILQIIQTVVFEIQNLVDEHVTK